jgi:predicted dehydrogenase
MRASVADPTLPSSDFDELYYDARMVRPPVERETLRIGVIGSGFGASVHVPALRRVPGVAVVALCGAQLGKARETAVALDIPHAADDYRELLFSGELDAVTIAAPPPLHHPMALAACEAGVHILCEKPMARNVAEARDMLRMAREAGVCHAVAHHRRHTPPYARMKALLEEGFLGRLHSVSATVYRSALADAYGRPHGWLAEAARGGGVLAAIGSHYVDALRWWFGEMHWVAGAVATSVPERSGADGETMQTVDADDSAALLVRFASGAIGSVHICYTAANEIGEELVATGSEGTLALQENGQLLGAPRGGQIRSMLTPGDQRTLANAGTGLARHIGPFSMLAGEWVLAMRMGTEAAPSFDDGAKVQEVLDAVSRSQQLSRWIDLSGNKWPV